MKSIRVGDRAPDVILASHDGERIPLAGFRGKQSLVLFFYPKDNTRVCTREACSFRDNYGEFTEAGAAVFGISSDSIESHRGFADANRLPYPLVADEDGSLRRAFGVPNTLGLVPGRVTYVIDLDGIVRSAFSSLLQGEKHVEEALRVVKELKQNRERSVN